MCSDLFGPIRMRSDTSGCVRKRPDAFGSIRTSSYFFREFVKVFSIFGSFRSFRDVFRPVRACSDAFGCDRMHPEAFGRSRSCHIPAKPLVPKISEIREMCALEASHDYRLRR